jgi:hypothetical protein
MLGHSLYPPERTQQLLKLGNDCTTNAAEGSNNDYKNNEGHQPQEPILDVFSPSRQGGEKIRLSGRKKSMKRHIRLKILASLPVSDLSGPPDLWVFLREQRSGLESTAHYGRFLPGILRCFQAMAV